MQIIFAYYINLLICSIIGPVWIHCESIDNVGVQILYRQGRHVLPSVWLMHIYTISNLAETFAQTSDYFSKITNYSFRLLDFSGTSVVTFSFFCLFEAEELLCH